MASSLHNALLSQDCEDSDEDDDDYVPTVADESDDDIDDAEVEEEPNSTNIRSSKKKRKLKQEKQTKSRKRKGGISLSDDEKGADEEQEEAPSLTPENEGQKGDPEVEKKKSDSLWADFLSDVKPPPKKASSSSPSFTSSISSPCKPNSKPQKVTITKVFEFAGESVVVKEEVDSNSQAAMMFTEEQSKPQQSSSNSPKDIKQLTSGKKPNGLNAVLGQVLGKKGKLSTLEKSKLDWNVFKREEGVEEVLDQYKKSKDGYLERQAFLERADLRQFEKEKEMRAANRSHRV